MRQDEPGPPGTGFEDADAMDELDGMEARDDEGLSSVLSSREDIMGYRQQ